MVGTRYVEVVGPRGLGVATDYFTPKLCPEEYSVLRT
jgi:hypothetical protein